MFNKNIGLVYDFVYRKVPSYFKSLYFDDLISCGNIGLLRACELFDPNRGIKFSTYAHHWIKQSVNIFLYEQATSVRVPRHASTVFRKFKEDHELITRSSKIKSGKNSVKLDYLDLKNLGQFCFKLDSLDGFKENHDNEEFDKKYKRFLNFLEDNKPISFDYDFNSLIENWLKIVDQNDIEIIKYRFGLDANFDRKTLTQVGKKFKLSKETIRQKLNKAIENLKTILV